MPNDEREQERMDIHYHSLRLTMNDKLYIAPIMNPTAVLDMYVNQHFHIRHLYPSMSITKIAADLGAVELELESGLWTSRMTIHLPTLSEPTSHQSSQLPFRQISSSKSWMPTRNGTFITSSISSTLD